MLINALIFGLIALLLLLGVREYLGTRQTKSEIKLADLELKALSADTKESNYLTEGDIPYIIRQLISALPKGLKLEIRKITPQKIKPVGNLKKFGVEEEIVARPQDLEEYLGRLSKIKTPVYVDRVVVKKVDDKTIAAKAYLAFLLVSGGASVSASEEVVFYEPKKKEAAVSVPTYKKKEVVSKPPSLQGIWSGEKKQVILDDKILGVGDSVNGFTVLDIQDDYVVVKKGPQKTYLKFE